MVIDCHGFIDGCPGFDSLDRVMRVGYRTLLYLFFMAIIQVSGTRPREVPVKKLNLPDRGVILSHQNNGS